MVAHALAKIEARSALDSRSRFRDKEPGWRSEKERGKKTRSLGTVTDPQRYAALPCPSRASAECARSVPRVCPKVSPLSLSFSLSLSLSLSSDDCDVPAKIRERRKKIARDRPRNPVSRGRAPSDARLRPLFCASFSFFFSRLSSSTG